MSWITCCFSYLLGLVLGSGSGFRVTRREGFAQEVSLFGIVSVRAYPQGVEIVVAFVDVERAGHLRQWHQHVLDHVLLFVSVGVSVRVFR